MDPASAGPPANIFQFIKGLIIKCFLLSQEIRVLTTRFCIIKTDDLIKATIADVVKLIVSLLLLLFRLPAEGNQIAQVHHSLSSYTAGVNKSCCKGRFLEFTLTKTVDVVYFQFRGGHLSLFYPYE